MSRSHRFREKIYPHSSGYKLDHNSGQIADNSATHFSRWKCEDNVGYPVVPSELYMVQSDSSGLTPINGKSPNGQIECHNFYGTRYARDWSEAEGYHPIPNDFWNWAATKLYSSTNPNRPGITPLTLLQDLKDLPKLLSGVKRLFTEPLRRLNAKDAANAQLATQFGWVPFAKDALDLLNLQASIAQRQNELKRMYSAGGLRRRVNIGSWSVRQDSSRQFLSSGDGLNHEATVTVSGGARSWGTIRWLPNFTPNCAPDDSALRYAAMRTVSGMSNIGLFKGLWDVMPWTWMIGWFTNVSDYAIAISDQIPCHGQNACVMYEAKNRWDFSDVSLAEGFTGGDGKVQNTFKRRKPVSGPSLSITEPFIGPARLSILSALAVQRLHR